MAKEKNAHKESVEKIMKKIMKRDKSTLSKLAKY